MCSGRASSPCATRTAGPVVTPAGTSTENVVVFLSRAGKGWTFAAEGAVESATLAGEIAAALAVGGKGK